LNLQDNGAEPRTQPIPAVQDSFSGDATPQRPRFVSLIHGPDDVVWFAGKG